MKGNSERVPNKNLKDFNGKPLYHWALSTLLASKYIDEVIINTDSDKIAEDSKQFGDKVKIVVRPEEIRGDFVPMNTIIGYDLSQTDGKIYLQTHSTNPLLKTESIDGAIKKMLEFTEDNQYDSIFSVTKLQTRLYKKDGSALNHNPKELLRTQDLEPLFEENSNFYVFTKESFKNADDKRIGIKPFMFETDKIESVDIDEPADFIIAETLHKLYQK